ncbi:MAG: hypothetical protein ABI467_16140 [Kofleriaceae bacterium]
MRTITLLMSIALGASVSGCGGPALGGVPHPNNAAMAGGVAAAAAAITLADPHAADRKPEQRVEQDKRPIDVKEQVPASAFDRLDSAGDGSGHELVRPHAGAPAPAATVAPTVVSPTVAPAAPVDAHAPTAAPKPAAKHVKPATSTKTHATLPTLPTPHDAVDPDHADTR